MSQIKKYEWIRFEDNDNGVTVSFDERREDPNTGEKGCFEHCGNDSRSFVFQDDNIDSALELLKALHLFNKKKRKGEPAEPVSLPSA